jgi:hypothetical protein
LAAIERWMFRLALNAETDLWILASDWGYANDWLSRNKTEDWDSD